MAFREMKKGEQVAPGEQWVTITKGISGYFAVIMWINNETPELGPFAEPWDTGMGRYTDPEHAKFEARAIAEDNNLPYQF